MAETYLPMKFEDDISKTVACREVTDRQTNKQTNEIAQRAILAKTDCVRHDVNDNVLMQFDIVISTMI